MTRARLYSLLMNMPHPLTPPPPALARQVVVVGLNAAAVMNPAGETRRLPVREALIALEAEGLISTQPRRGSFVSMLEPQDVIDHFAIVGLISGVAVARAAMALTAEQFTALEQLCDAMEQATDAESQAEFNNRFHEIINRAGSSMRLRSVLRGLSRSIPSKFFEMPTDWRTWGALDHRAILDALRRGDSEKAARLTQEHLLHGGEAAVAGLKATGLWRR